MARQPWTGFTYYYAALQFVISAIVLALAGLAILSGNTPPSILGIVTMIAMVVGGFLGLILSFAAPRQPTNENPAAPIATIISALFVTQILSTTTSIQEALPIPIEWIMAGILVAGVISLIVYVVQGYKSKGNL